MTKAAQGRKGLFWLTVLEKTQSILEKEVWQRERRFDLTGNKVLLTGNRVLVLSAHRKQA